MTSVHSFIALADPTRRALYDRLRRRPHTVGELARVLHVTQPAVSQHLRVLRQARLVQGRRDGTKHIHAPDPEGVRRLREYVDSLWTDVLSAYGASFAQPTAPDSGKPAASNIHRRRRAP